MSVDEERIAKAEANEGNSSVKVTGGCEQLCLLPLDSYSAIALVAIAVSTVLSSVSRLVLFSRPCGPGSAHTARNGAGASADTNISPVAIQ